MGRGINVKPCARDSIPKDGRTRRFLRAVTSHSTHYRILLAANAVHGTLGVSLSLSSVVLDLTLGVFLLAGLLPRLGAGEVADRLDGGTLGRVILAGRLAAGDSLFSAYSPGDCKGEWHILWLAVSHNDYGENVCARGAVVVKRK